MCYTFLKQSESTRMKSNEKNLIFFTGNDFIFLGHGEGEGGPCRGAGRGPEGERDDHGRQGDAPRPADRDHLQAQETGETELETNTGWHQRRH